MVLITAAPVFSRLAFAILSFLEGEKIKRDHSQSLGAERGRKELFVVWFESRMKCQELMKRVPPVGLTQWPSGKPGNNTWQDWELGRTRKNPSLGHSWIFRNSREF